MNVEDRLRDALSTRADQYEVDVEEALRSHQAARMADDPHGQGATPAILRHRFVAIVTAAAAVAVIAAGIPLAAHLVGDRDQRAVTPPATETPTAAPSPTSSPSPSATSASPSPVPTDTAAGTPVQPLLARDVEAPRVDIPWAQVGPGWTLALWNPTSGDPLAAPAPWPASTLYLVNPIGGRYAITSIPAHARLLDWSPDKTRALFFIFNVAPGEQPPLTEVDLTTGRTGVISSADLDGVVLQYTNPTGDAILGFRSTDTFPLERIALDGTPQMIWPSTLPAGSVPTSLLQSPDGRQIVVASSGGLALLDQNGRIQRQLPEPNGHSCIQVIGWWETNVVVAHCVQLSTATDELWAFPISGAPATAITNDLSTSGVIERVPSGTYLNGFIRPGCAGLEKLTADGTSQQVVVPHMANGALPFLIGANGNVLTLEASTCNVYSESVFTFDTSTGQTTVLIGQGLNGGDIVGAIAYRVPIPVGSPTSTSSQPPATSGTNLPASTSPWTAGTSCPARTCAKSG
jgi:hypothetical protein